MIYLSRHLPSQKESSKSADPRPYRTHDRIEEKEIHEKCIYHRPKYYGRSHVVKVYTDKQADEGRGA